MILSQNAHAIDVPQSFTLDGQLYGNAAGTTALLDASIGVKIQIYDENKTCILYEETQTISTLASKGFFSVQVGSETGNSKRTTFDAGNTMSAVFQNITSVTGKTPGTGAACVIPATSGSRRYVRTTITPSTMGGSPRTLSPDISVDSVPNAVVAERAESVQGFRAGDLLKVNTASGSVLSQTNLESLFTSSARFNELTALVNGTSANYMRSNSPSGAQLPVLTGAPTSPTTGSMWYDTTDSKIKYQTGGGPITISSGAGSGTVTSVAVTAPSEISVAGSAITTSGTIALTWANQTANKVFASPDSATGAPAFRSLVAGDIPTLPWSKITSGTPTTLSGYGITDAILNAGGTPSIMQGLDAGKPATGTAGRIYIAYDAGKIYRDSGAVWDTIASNGGGGSGTVASGTTGKLAKYTGATTVGDSVIAESSGNIGIGMTATNKLDVAGNIGLDNGNAAGARLALYSQGFTNWRMANESGSFRIFNGEMGSVPVTIEAAAANDSFFIKANGNIGMGTTSPGARLEVAGQVKITGGTPGAGKVLTSDAAGLASWTNFSVGSLLTSGGAAQFANASCTNTQTLTWSSLTGTFTCSNIDMSGVASGTSGKLAKFTGANAVGDSVITEDTGKIGIGTASPSTTLTVNGTTTLTDGSNPITLATSGDANQSILTLQAPTGRFASLRLANNGHANIGSSFEFLNGSNSGSRFLYVNSIANGSHYFASDILSSGTAYPIKFRVGNDWSTSSDLLTLATNQNVGIGTASPGAKLEVAGQVKITGGTPGLGKVLTSDAAGLATWETLAAGSGTVSSGTTGKLSKYTGATTVGDSVITESSSNIGIGTASPGYTLTVNGTIAQGTSTAGGTGATAIGSATAASGFYAFSQGTSTTASGTNAVAVNTSTTASSGSAFAAGNTTTAAGYNTASFGENTTATAQSSFVTGRYNVGGGTNNSWVATDPLFEIGIGATAGTKANAVTVLKNGKVGIGTATPTTELDINKGTMTFVNKTTGTKSLSIHADDLSGDGRLIITSAGNNSGTRLWLDTPSGTTATGFSLAHNGTEKYFFGTTSANAFGMLYTDFFYKNSSDTVVATMTTGGAMALGTASAPSGGSTLEVNGTVKITGGTPGAGKVLTSDAAGLASWQTPSSGSGTISSGTTGKVPKYTGATTIGDSAITDSSGNIGIGTASPGKLLHVYGDQTQGIAKFERVNSATNLPTGVVQLKAMSTGDMTDGFGPALMFYAGDTGVAENNFAEINAVREGADNNGALRFVTYSGGSASERFRIMSSGNVGVGTSTPGARLQIKGSTSDNSAYAVVTENSSGTILTRTRNDGMFLVPGSFDLGGSGAGGSIYAAGFGRTSGPMLYDAAGTALTLGAASTTTTMTLTSAGNAEFTGQVKIAGGTPGLGKVLTSNAAGLATWETPTTGSGTVSSGTTGKLPKYTGATTVGDSIMTESSSKIGINMSPSATLDVTGTGTGGVQTLRVGANPGGTGASNFNSIVFNNQYTGANFKNQFSLQANGVEKWALGNDSQGAGAQNFYIYDNVSTRIRFVIDANGNTLSDAGFGFTSGLLQSTSVDTAITRLGAGKIGFGNGSAGNTTGTVVAANVGVSNSSPTTMLHVGASGTTAGTTVATFETATGACTMTPATSGTGIACSSDERLKRNIASVTGDYALDRLSKMQAVTYEFKKDPTDTRHTGFIAQQLLKIAPEFVRVDHNGYYQVYYDGFIPWITEAVKELFNRSNADRARIESLERENEAMKSYLCQKDPTAPFCKK